MTCFTRHLLSPTEFYFNLTLMWPIYYTLLSPDGGGSKLGFIMIPNFHFGHLYLFTNILFLGIRDSSIATM